jgi:ubiquinone biosynthesis protein UbiJ
LIPIYAALNHLLRQNAWAATRLQPYAGKTVRFNLPLVSSTVTLVDGGEFVPAIENAIPNATITLTPMAALRRIAGQPLQPLQPLQPDDYRMEGDAELATSVGNVLQQLEWEYEEDLSRVIGDIPAQQLVSFGKQAVHEGRRQIESLAGMFAEFWLEEQPLIAKKRHLEQFATEVDTLRNDVERLEKQLAKLAASL